ncbi:MAG: hypothetical protein BZY79_02835 [SAR202 cluster bacterium Casp-Chloro-G4]|nr:DUF1800 domain-containing protein [Chloroflexota bacterium]MDA1228230.1 DUF1800 domain-containing protein [Chloroflexota bacterium]PKB61632.1 MAG: hypothetical protein BZY79_02835 [SAR202 cluster bacterium Casp-Chloro-G4]
MTTIATDKALVAHLLRRAGFGATFQEIDKFAEMGYEETVDYLLHPERVPDIDEDLLERYYIDWKESRNIEGALVETVYRFNARAGVRPMQEKIALFWHHVFATGLAKVLHEKTLLNQIDMFRDYGLGSYRDLLVHLAKDPAMIFWLDNNVNHKGAINENWGRELLELFSMGIGMDGKDNYTENDVQEVARAFTGWTMDDDNTASIPFGKTPWLFKFDADDHDYGEKTVLGETGNFTGEDVIDIIAKQPSTARFICRHLYNFFVADEVQVPSWRDTAPLDPEAIRIMEDAYFESNYDIRSILKVVFNSEFFKNARFQKVKSPAEVVCGTMHIVGSYKFPDQRFFEEALECRYMNQDLLNPPSVEGWHTGKEWIDSGSLVERINYVADELSDTTKPGVRAMVDNLLSRQSEFTPEGLIEGCLELLGYFELKDKTRSDLIELVYRAGEIRTDNPEDRMFAEQLMLRTLKMIGATREYQFA